MTLPALPALQIQQGSPAILPRQRPLRRQPMLEHPILFNGAVVRVDLIGQRSHG